LLKAFLAASALGTVHDVPGRGYLQLLARKRISSILARGMAEWREYGNLFRYISRPAAVRRSLPSALILEAQNQ
jgi:hypothetical protein